VQAEIVPVQHQAGDRSIRLGSVERAVNPGFDITKSNPFNSASTVATVFLIVAFFWLALVTIDERPA
jgi:hypothetical protein